MSSPEVVALTARIAAAYAANQSLHPDQLPALIATIHGSLAGLTTGPDESPAPPQRPPAVPVRKSVTPDFIICLEDGKKLKTLKRHLRATYGLTPDEYRTKWGLPSDYPMVAPNYAAERSAMARASGLGKASTGRKAGSRT